MSGLGPSGQDSAVLVVGNTADDGAGMYVTSAGDAQLTNVVFENNAATDIAGGIRLWTSAWWSARSA